MTTFHGARVRTFEVIPSLPEPLRPLLELAYNLWWSWHPEAVELFIRLDRELWRDTHHNPVLMLGQISQQKLEAAARDEGFLTTLGNVTARLKRHQTRPAWHQRNAPELEGKTIAYFCAEFGITECLQIYSGGLGCLAGDHLKSAAELGLPLVGVGLLYRHGYFQQYLSADGWQQERIPNLDFANLPVEEVRDATGETVRVVVRLPGRDLHVALWKATVGRITLYLLDTNLSANRADDRDITSQLYGGDMEQRIKQEIVLGIGGLRALEAIGIVPDVCHMNEGHAAFLALEHIRRLIAKHNVSFDEAREQAAASHVFTTHTPVPAGIDRFPPSVMENYFRDYVPDLKLDMEGLLALGRENVFNKHEAFSMAVLAIRCARFANGVSKLHGEVSRDMWQGIWPGVPKEEVPIGHVTNGVHARTWLNPDLILLFDRYMGARWQDQPTDQSVWNEINDVPDEELWRIHERRRQRLIVWARRMLKQQLEARGVAPEIVRSQADGLSDSALTIGFARRFATYKRGNLILRDAERLKRLLTNTQQPIQFLIAGKAHPADGGGKQLIQQLVQFSASCDAGHRIVFIENYDMYVARYLVQGCDIWLNTPRRGMEASGTSGMKAAMNGVLNCSILDGWWDEAAETTLGWSIGRREDYDNTDTADDIESRALYDLFEKQIVPLFYQRDEYGVPREWVARMKKCIATLAPAFNTNRMVSEYAGKYYAPAARASAALAVDGLKPAVALNRQKNRLRQQWHRVKVAAVKATIDTPLGVNEQRAVEVHVELGELTPAEVRVQAYCGRLDTDNQLVNARAIDLKHTLDQGNGKHTFQGNVGSTASGRHGLAVRVLPGGEMLTGQTEPGLIAWETQSTPQPPTLTPPKRSISATH